MSHQETLALLERYYAAFNAGDLDSMRACLADDVAHDINQGERQIGKDDLGRLCRAKACKRHGGAPYTSP